MKFLLVLSAVICSSSGAYALTEKPFCGKVGYWKVNSPDPTNSNSRVPSAAANAFTMVLNDGTGTVIEASEEEVLNVTRISPEYRFCVEKNSDGKLSIWN